MTFSTLFVYFLTFALCLGAAALLAAQFRSNRLLFWCIIAALGIHLTTFGYLYWRSLQVPPPERLVKISIIHTPVPTPPPPKLQPKPKAQAKPAPRIIPIPKPKPTLPPPPVVAPPKGRTEESKAKVMPKGKTLDKTKVGKSGKPSPKSAHPAPNNPSGAKKADRKLTSNNGGNRIASDNGPAGPDEPNMGIDDSGIGKNDIKTDSHEGGSFKGGTGEGGEGGDDAGTPDGSGKGGIPKGFKNGKVNGRAYYIRLKHGSGAWNAYDDGTSRLLSFLSTNGNFKCESESRAMTATELQDKYMRAGSPPTFLYIYCDDSFALSSAEVNILHKYVGDGGFLFLDSRPDDDVRSRVAAQLDRVLSGARLSVIPKSHPINNALYKMNYPGIGENFNGQKNYGVMQNGRLVAFYTPGNFSHFYSAQDPTPGYNRAQYEMGANVMVYAMFKGDMSGVTKKSGDDARVTEKALKNLGFIEAAKPTPKKPGQTVKIKPKAGQEGQPEDVKILD